MESEVYKNADKFVVDSWLHCKNKSDMQRMLKENYPERKGSLRRATGIALRQKAGPAVRQERIFVRAIGLVNQDIAMADHIYHSALEKGIGTRLPY